MSECKKYMDLGEQAEKNKLYSTAVQHYLSAAKCFSKAEEEKNARKAYEKIVKISEKYGKKYIEDMNWIDAGLIYYYSGIARAFLMDEKYSSDFEKAMEIFERGMESYSTSRQFSYAARCALEAGLLTEKIRKDQKKAYEYYFKAAKFYASNYDYQESEELLRKCLNFYKENRIEEEYREVLKSYIETLNEAIFHYGQKKDFETAAEMSLKLSKLYFQMKDLEKTEEFLIKAIENLSEIGDERISTYIISLVVLYLIREDLSSARECVNIYNDIVSKKIVNLCNNFIKAIETFDISLLSSVVEEVKTSMKKDELLNAVLEGLLSKFPSILVSISSDKNEMEVGESTYVSVEIENNYKESIKVIDAKITTNDVLRSEKDSLTVPLELKPSAKYVESFSVEAMRSGMGVVGIVCNIKIEDIKYTVKAVPLRIRVPALKPEIKLDIEENVIEANKPVEINVRIRNDGEGMAKEVVYSFGLPEEFKVIRGFVKNMVEEIPSKEEKKITLKAIAKSDEKKSVELELSVEYKDEDGAPYSESIKKEVQLIPSVEPETIKISIEEEKK
ncbi:MAG: hypothetical protein ACTSR0_05510 [Candidatus Asgardarchaeia archaeon]